MPYASLPAITALVRSGAVERAWQMYERGGYAARTDDPTALAVKGRLLKAQARMLQGADRAATMAQAADCYARANTLAAAPYLAINAASLALQAGDAVLARRRAEEVIQQLVDAGPLTDTPYYLAATRAEALLLLGDQPGAEQAMLEAARHDPDGWDDRAVTLSQLGEIIEAGGLDRSWLDQFRAPPSLHFAGHMGIASAGASERKLSAELDALFASNRPGFAWGALAAGADIIIAEKLAALGCTIHAVLPCPVAVFEQQSVAPAGDEWVGRFRKILPLCASLRIAGPEAASAHDPIATAFAGELAIGAARRSAARLASSCQQLIVIDSNGGGANTARQARMWEDDFGPQTTFIAERDLAVEALFPAENPDPARNLALMIECRLDPVSDDPELSSAQIAALTAPIAQALAEMPREAVRADIGRWQVVSTDIEAALAAIAKLLEQSGQGDGAPPAIGAHLAICNLLTDAASGATVAYGPGMNRARRLSELAAAGTALISEELAVFLSAKGRPDLRIEPYLPDDAELGGTAYLLIRA